MTPWNLLEGVASLPRGFSKENRDSPRQPRAGGWAGLPLSFPCFCTSELLAGLQNTPPGRRVPGPHSGKPQTVRLTENRWPFFLRGPRPGAWRVLCAGLGRPGPHSAFRDTQLLPVTAAAHVSAPGRKSARPHLPARHSLSIPTPSTAAFSADPPLDPPSRQAPGRPWPLATPLTPVPDPPPPQGNPPSLSLASCLEGGCSLSLLSTMDICYQGKPTVANMSPRHVSGPAGVYSSPDSL